MITSLHQVSGRCFYLLGITFFGAYLLVRNGILEPFPAWWMHVGDLPLALSAIVYGGTSLYLSVKPTEAAARLRPLMIIVPLGILFLAIVAMNFGPTAS